MFDVTLMPIVCYLVEILLHLGILRFPFLENTIRTTIM